MTTNLPPNPKICAYCGTAGAKLTKEHSISKFLLREFKKRVGDSPAIFQQIKSKIDAENVTTKDVCSQCNNVELQLLDSYGVELYHTYFSKIVEKGESVQFRYDYDLLSRWILKTAYNVERTGNKPVHSYSQFAKYCVAQAPRPANFILFLFLLSPYELNENQKLALAQENLKPLHRIEPWGYGTKTLARVEFDRGVVIPDGTIFQINAYNFVMIPLSTNYDVRNKQRKQITQWLRDDFKDIWLLESGKPSVTVRPSFLTYVDAKKLSGYLQDQRYKDWLKKYLDDTKRSALM